MPIPEMTHEKAVEILRDLMTDMPQFPPDDRRGAVVMAIASLIAEKLNLEGG